MTYPNKKPGCNCIDYLDNIEKLNAVFTMEHIHGRPYLGKSITHCPWCGAKLDFQKKYQEINSNLTHIFFNSMGIGKQKQVDMLEVSLIDMCYASEWASNESKKPWPEGTTRSIPVHSDPRLISAIYTGLHYQGQDPSGKIEQVVDVGDKGVFVIILPPLSKDEDEDEDE